MCGIAGFLRRDGAPASREAAAAMAATMHHRGPDGRGAWADGPVALAHARLAVRDRSDAAAQPMVAPGGEGVLVYNGELVGEGPLRDALAREGWAFRGPGDAEVVLAACARWGPERAAAAFDGMFAFAWWDARARALWLVRDRFGTKPLHVHTGPAGVAFGSEARAIAAFTGPLAVDRHLVVRRSLPWTTDPLPPPFVGLEDVPPGGAWRVHAGGIERRVHTDLLASVDPARVVAAAAEPVEAAAVRVREVVETAVRAHLVSDVPLAAFTSGGVDSNLVAAIALETRPDLVAYTMACGGPDDELPAATRVARHLGLTLRPVVVDRATFLRTWPEAAHVEEIPTDHESHVAALVLARAARADGFSVIVTGEGSDELFGGYDFFFRTRKAWREATRPWARLTHRGRARLRALQRVPFRYQAVRTEPETHARYEALLDPEADSRARRLLARFASLRPPEDAAAAALAVDAVRRYLVRILFRHDRTSMAASVEARVPFVSNAVADVGLHLAPRHRWRGRVGKWLLKRVAAARLPAEVLTARKKGFPVDAAHHRGTSALLVDGWVADTFGWTRASTAEVLPAVEADPVRRFHLVSLEVFGRVHARGEAPAAVAERLLAAAAAADRARGRPA